MTLPSLVMHISEVPAPTSINPMFRSLYCSGIAIFIAAIGSNVRLATCRPAYSTDSYRPSTTSSGRNVAINVTPILFALCPSRLLISKELSLYVIGVLPTQ